MIINRFFRDTVLTSYDDATFLNVFMDQLNAENLRQILELLEHSAEDLVRGKVNIK
jgi:hypothetical protein